MLSRLTDDYPHIKTCIFIINKKFEGKKKLQKSKRNSVKDTHFICQIIKV